MNDKPSNLTTWLGDTPEARKLSLALIPIGAMMFVLGGIAQGLNWLGAPFLQGWQVAPAWHSLPVDNFVQLD
jgi:hypothetical protein